LKWITDTAGKIERLVSAGWFWSGGDPEAIGALPRQRIWVDAFERSEMMTTYKGDLQILQPPVDWQLEGSSAWVNLMTGRDRVATAGWSGAPKVEG